IFDGLGMEFTLVRASVKVMFPESSEDLLDVLPVLFRRVGINEDVILKHFVDEALERCWSVRKAKRHNPPLKGAVASSESGLPLISGGDPDQVVSMPEVNLGVDAGLPGAVQEVGN
ncbi:hypothetical protein FOMPIDRAFT_58640, partial [Fomitopsis schrenkii]